MRALVVVGLLLPASLWADPGKVEVAGRVFARGETARLSKEEFATEARIQSARLEASYEWQWLKANVEVELHSGADLRDVYVRGTWGEWRAQAGQFKEPISAMEMESLWVLPLAGRGFLHDMLAHHLGIGFRHPGAMGAWRGDDELKPRVTIGLFQGTAADDAPQPDLLRTAARASIAPGPVEVGVFFEHRDSQPVVGLETERFWSAGADATLDLAGLRAWADVVLGSSFLDANVLDDDEAIFTFGRLLVCYRIGGDHGGDVYVEPYLLLGALDPDADIREDLMSELAGGVNVGAWKRVRLQLEAERWGVQRNTPILYGARDRLAFLAQIGAAF